MIYACGCGERDIPFFIRTPLGMIGIRTLKFLSALFKKWNLKGSFFLNIFDKFVRSVQIFLASLKK